MAKRKSFFSRFRIVICRSPLLLKCAVLAALVVSVAALTVIRVNIEQTKLQTESTRNQAAQVERENKKLDTMIQQKDTVEGSKNIAKEKLGLVEKDTTFYHIVENQD